MLFPGHKILQLNSPWFLSEILPREIVSFPLKNFFHGWVNKRLPDGKSQKIPLNHQFPLFFLLFSFGFPSPSHCRKHDSTSHHSGATALAEAIGGRGCVSNHFQPFPTRDQGDETKRCVLQRDRFKTLGLWCIEATILATVASLISYKLSNLL